MDFAHNNSVLQTRKVKEQKASLTCLCIARMQLANGRDRLDQADWIQTALQLSQAGNLPWIRAEGASSVLPVNIQQAWSPSSRILLSPAEEWDRNLRSHHDIETHRDCHRSSEGGGDHRRYLFLLLWLLSSITFCIWAQAAVLLCTTRLRHQRSNI